jgi:RNA-directed DNA polymerase
VKRYSYLFERVCDFRALTTAAIEAARGKKSKSRVAIFFQNLETEVIELEKELREKKYQPCPYHTFTVHDPKVRMICAADFRDRVVHHAICKVLEPIFERSFIYDTYACRKGKGTHLAIRKAQTFCRCYCYFLKLDVHKFFDSVDHETLKALLCRKIKDLDMLQLLDVFIDHPVPWTEPGKGIPIGNLTSQHFANFYLSPLDHFIKEILHIKAYARYMDDLLFFSNDKDDLWNVKRKVEYFLNSELSLRLKDGFVLLAPTTQGLPFLGLRLFPGVIRLSRKGWRRFRRKMIIRENLLAEGKLDPDRFVRSVSSMVGHIGHANTRNLRASFFERPGANEALTG